MKNEYFQKLFCQNLSSPIDPLFTFTWANCVLVWQCISSEWGQRNGISNAISCTVHDSITQQTHYDSPHGLQTAPVTGKTMHRLVVCCLVRTLQLCCTLRRQQTVCCHSEPRQSRIILWTSMTQLNNDCHDSRNTAETKENWNRGQKTKTVLPSCKTVFCVLYCFV